MEGMRKGLVKMGVADGSSQMWLASIWSRPAMLKVAPLFIKSRRVEKPWFYSKKMEMTWDSSLRDKL